jgi:hypothetical protein
MQDRQEPPGRIPNDPRGAGKNPEQYYEGDGNYTHFTAGLPEPEALISRIEQLREELFKDQSAIQKN